MFITVANDKGGVAKTTTAVHIAAYFQKLGATLLIDKDPNGSASVWGRKGKLPFKIMNWEEGTYHARSFKHVIIDTKAGEEKTDLVKLASGCDLLIIPTTPATLDTAALIDTLSTLKGATNKYKVLIAKVPARENDAAQLRAALEKNGIPLFKNDIPRLKVFERAAAEGVPVYDLGDPYAQIAWEAYESAGKEIKYGKAAAR